MDNVQSSRERSEIVRAFKEAGKGGERYGVVCPKCFKRICLQGWAWAIEHSPNFCLCRENYNGEGPVDDIITVMDTHGIERLHAFGLRPKTKMSEATVKKAKKNKKGDIVVDDPTVIRERRNYPTFQELLAKRRRERN